VPADVDGEITGIAFAAAVVVGTEDDTYLDLRFSVIRGGVTIYQGNSGYSKLDADHVLMHFLVPGSFKHKVENDRLRVQFYWWEASKSRFFKGFGFHLIRRYEEKKKDLIDIQATS
jgi:hypothetical protein